MPLQNRVLPDGRIVALPARGLLMGNRGCLHDAHRQIVRQHQRKAWITCLLAFKGRKRTLMTPGQYTELFFLDEVTALAAGHRPCNECRPERFKAFKAAWLQGNLPGQQKLSAADLDESMHRERSGGRETVADYARLPTGAMLQDAHEHFYLVKSGTLLQWLPDGYHAPGVTAVGPLRLVTPPGTLNVLRSGYVPELHPTAINL